MSVAFDRKNPPFPVKNTGTQKTRINLGWGTLKINRDVALEKEPKNRPEGRPLQNQENT